MPSQEEIEHQKKLLEEHRGTLKRLQLQRAKYSAGNVPSHIDAGIDEARAGIKKCKESLRSWHIEVEDLPDDEEEYPVVPPKMPPPPTPRRPFPWRLVAAIAVVLVAAGVGFALHALWTPSRPPAVSLVGLRYFYDGYDQRLVDLRTADTSGIPVAPEKTLRFLDVRAQAQGSAADYGVQAEIYANDESGAAIGITDFVPIRSGAFSLGDVEGKPDFSDADAPKAWRVLPSWKRLIVALVTYRNGQAIERNTTTIKLDPAGQAWLADPPEAHLTSLVYSLNDGPRRVLDLRAIDKGLDVIRNDTLTLHEIWYSAGAESGTYTLAVEAHLGQGFDSATYQRSGASPLREGMNVLNTATSLRWTIPADVSSLVVRLVRSDHTILDTLVLASTIGDCNCAAPTRALKATAPGLI